MIGAPHVVPLGDTREHVVKPECWCRPTEQGGVWIHRSADRREEYEEGRKPH